MFAGASTDTSTASGSKCSRAPLLQAVHHELVQVQGIPYVWGASLRRHPLLHLLGCTVCDLFPDPQLTVVMQSWFTIREPRGSNDAELYVHWHLPNHLRAMLRWPIPFIAQGYDVLAVSRGQLVRGRQHRVQLSQGLGPAGGKELHEVSSQYIQFRARSVDLPAVSVGHHLPRGE